METTPVYVGIDVAKESLDIATTSEHAIRFAYDHKGMKEAVCFLKKPKPFLVVLEATGRLESALVATLQGAGLPVVVVNPR